MYWIITRNGNPYSLYEQATNGGPPRKLHKDIKLIQQLHPNDKIDFEPIVLRKEKTDEKDKLSRS